MGNPSGSTTTILSKLFKKSNLVPSTRKRSFDPTSECVVAKQKAKKKATNIRKKPKNLNVVLLKEKPESVPRGRVRKNLNKSGRIMKLQFRRCMSPSEIKSIIVDGFKDLGNIEEARFLRCGQDNLMVVNDEQDLNGDGVIELAGQGSLYLTQKKVLVCSLYVYVHV